MRRGVFCVILSAQDRAKDRSIRRSEAEVIQKRQIETQEVVTNVPGSVLALLFSQA